VTWIGTDWPGATGAGVAGCVAAGVAFFALSRRVVPELPPRVAKMDSVSEVSMNSAAAIVVAFDNTVADPRGPNTVWDPMPPKAPAKSAALPLWSSTTTTRNTQTITCITVRRIPMLPSGRKNDFDTASAVHFYPNMLSLFVGRDARNPLANHQRMDVIGTLVCFHRFQVAEVAHDGVLVHDPVAPQQVA
jgi:hypothetical protein